MLRYGLSIKKVDIHQHWRPIGDPNTACFTAVGSSPPRTCDATKGIAGSLVSTDPNFFANENYIIKVLNQAYIYIYNSLGIIS